MFLTASITPGASAVGWVGDADSLHGNALTWVGTVSGLVHASGKSAAKWKPRSHRRLHAGWGEPIGTVVVSLVSVHSGLSCGCLTDSGV